MLKWSRESLRAAVKRSSCHYHTIQAVPREFTGSRLAARERAQGRIPAIVFTQGEEEEDNKGHGTRPISRKHIITTERKQINSLLKTIQLPYFCSTTFHLQIRAGSGSSCLLESGRILPIKVHRNLETGQVLNLVFVWADDNSELNVDVPVIFKGEDLCRGLKKGGYLNQIRTSLKYLCPAEHIPPKIEVDLSNLDIGDRVSMRDIEVHPSMKLLSKNDNMPVCKIMSTKSEVSGSGPIAA
ncbi:ribosomal protein L25/Gln-tRNA synthetase, anti-codon-binding domain-containing protein [Tasmannia lanceolata]|uniref:ribosomal protein L25/Gln-tRNA synthetase, anti-codon-binding domain-containing protein n=1 Tax=Tasmannia lanceolata TaxID=3420 RepID=UPI004062DC12